MYPEITERVSKKAALFNRPKPTLIAVSKMQPNENVEAVLQAGHKVYGENRVQEAAGKWPDFQAQYGKVELHLLGPLQSNKVNQALELFDVIHSLDRAKLARRIADAAEKRGACPDLFIQVNTGEEPQKAGVLPGDLPEFINEIKPLSLPIIGLMCIPPASQDPRPHFQMLRLMAQTHGLENLSMGMSGDFEIAIEEGATHIRVGSAIFGARGYSSTTIK